MGSWSVYCGISQIAITAGNDCVLLPIKKNTGEYMPYIISTLPIFGKYDDYGGLDRIEEDENTKLIEEHFGLSILDFTKLFTDGIAYDREECEKLYGKMLNHNEMKDWNFLFMDRKVYDFMSTYIDSDDKGHLDFGNEMILKLLGFKYIGENSKNLTDNPKRYRYEWEFEGKKFHSDGTWLHYKKNAIYNFHNRLEKYSSKGLEEYITIPEDKMWIGEKASWQLWNIFDDYKKKEILGRIMGIDRWYESPHDIFHILKRVKMSLVDNYMDQINVFGNQLSDLMTIQYNLHPMSGAFLPFVIYATPQCGEFKKHQVLLEKFAEINNEYVKEEDI